VGVLIGRRSRTKQKDPNAAVLPYDQSEQHDLNKGQWKPYEKYNPPYDSSVQNAHGGVPENGTYLNGYGHQYLEMQGASRPAELSANHVFPPKMSDSRGQ
jgi:hypothetical protein